MTTARSTHPLSGLDAKNPEALQAALTALFAQKRSLFGDAQMNAGDGGAGGNEGGSGGNDSGENGGDGDEGKNLNPDGTEKTPEQIAAEAEEKDKGENPPPPPAPAEWDGKIESLPTGAQKIISDLRAEIKSVRTKAQDGSALATENESLKAENTSLKINAALNDVFAKQNVKPADTLRYLKGGDELVDLDPTADDFTSKLEAMVKNAAKNASYLKLPALPSRGGVDLDGDLGNGEVTQAQFDAMPGWERNAFLAKNPTRYRQLAANI